MCPFALLCQYDLTMRRPEYIAPLREEVRLITEKYGWTKDSISKMVKVDSFIKETMRVAALGSSE
jgi:hypothetical protein